MDKTIKILSPCGMLGYGFPKESFIKGIEEKPDAIVVDAGSTDAGPHKLGAGVAIVSRRAAKKDIELLLTRGLRNKIPVIIGSAGGAGAKPHVEWTLDIIDEILRENDLKAKIAVIWSDFSKEEIIEAVREDRIVPLGKGVKELKEDIILETNSIAAQMGHEPIIEALSNENDIIICGRAYDPSPFAAVGIYHGMDIGLSYHLGKILECGALCAEPGTTKDCILGTLTKDSFTVKALNPIRKCNEVSVAAHTFYEKDHPYILHGPGFILDLSKCEFKEIEDGVVEVRNSQFIKNEDYFIKLEGARKVSYRTFVIAGIRDPLLLSSIEEVEELVLNQVHQYYKEIPREQYNINFYNYGKDGVMGKKEKESFSGHEIGVMFEVVAETQELANSICATVRSTFLHYGYDGRKSTAGNLAFPFAPSDIEFGPVYEFSIYHLMKVDNGLKPFKIQYLWR
ncbi:acyclic terpene utilization AtuA family protein [Desnuesiella massiliensis]|uniref:acyclic terpene utilization AtuA family protein n=1 Tax=Desnuesiella massiliensis TaxID=1650662 RepID=UPI0006E3C8CA|nr:acyclic terpene utilization AtuA family protein [Desnuesiella massiliensis]